MRTRNRAPEIRINPDAPYTYEAEESVVWLISIVDQDGDSLNISLSPHELFTVLQTQATRYQTLIQIQLNTTRGDGVYSISIRADDGYDTSHVQPQFRIGPAGGDSTPTPSPTRTAAPSPSPTVTQTNTATPVYSPTPTPERFTPSPTPTLSVLTATPTPVPTRILQPTRVPRATHTPTPSWTATPSPTSTHTPTASATSPETEAPRLLPIPDIRALVDVFEENVIPLRHYGFDPDTPADELQWSLHPSGDDARLFLDAQNRLSVGPSSQPGIRSTIVQVSDGINAATQIVRIKRSRFMLDMPFMDKPEALLPGERWTSTHSLYDRIRPPDYPRTSIALSISSPLPEGIRSAGIHPDGRYWIEANAHLGSPVFIPIIAQAVEPSPTITPQPTAQATSTPVVRPTVQPDLVLSSCDTHTGFALRGSLQTGEDPIGVEVHPNPPPEQSILLISNYGESHASLLVLNHAGHNTETQLAAGQNVLNAIWGDWNKDGIYDIAILGGYASTITLYWGITATTFREGPFWQLPDLVDLPEERNTRSRLRLMTEHSIHSSKAPWLVVAQPHELLAYEWNGNRFVIAHRQPIPYDVLQLESARFDAGDTESLVVSRTDPNGYLTHQFRNGRWIVQEQRSTEDTFAGNMPQAMTIHDMNRDGHDDVALIAFNRELFFRMSQAPRERTYSAPLDLVVSDITAADWNQDGVSTLLVAGFQISTQQAAIAMLCGDAQGTMTEHTTSPIPRQFPVGQQFSMTPFDFDGDPYPDLLILDRAMNQATLFQNLTPSRNHTPAP